MISYRIRTVVNNWISNCRIKNCGPCYYQMSHIWPRRGRWRAKASEMPLQEINKVLQLAQASKRNPQIYQTKQICDRDYMESIHCLIKCLNFQETIKYPLTQYRPFQYTQEKKD